jgi:hypothetical protein
MRKVLIVICLLLISAVVVAQDAAPVITTFTADQTVVPASRLEDQSARVLVRWAVQDRPLTSNLMFEQVLPDGTTVSVELPRNVNWVNSEGAGEIAPILPASEPDSLTVRLSVVDEETAAVLAQQDLTLRVDYTDEPMVSDFTISLETVSAETLRGGQARVPVAWTAINRPANSNLVFEQVLPGGDAVNIELPRNFETVPSQGNGAVAPILPDGDPANIVLRVRLIDIPGGDIYDESERVLPVNYGASDPQITRFTSTVNSVIATDLADGAQVPVQWSVQDRPMDASLVFEQVFADGTTRSAELPRPNPYVVSSGSGVVDLAADPGDGDQLRLRLRVVEADTVLAESLFRLPIVGTGGPLPSISQFEITPTGGASGTLINIQWATANASEVNIYTNGRFFDDLPPTGDLTATIDELAAQANPVEVSISAYGAGAPVGQTRYITLDSSASIDTFTVNPDQIAPGGALTFTWAIQGDYTGADIMWSPGQGVMQVANDLPASGSTAFTPDPTLTGIRSFVLVMIDSAGVEHRAFVQVSIGG